jgi:FkbM family methyltransferase
MLINMRRLLRKYFRRLGFQRKIAPDFIDVINSLNIELLLDVGSNDGAYGREIRDAGYKGLIVSFEPNPYAYKRLIYKIRNDTNWVAHQYALGESEGEALLNISQNDVLSSFKSFTNFGKIHDGKIASKEVAKVLTIDKFLSEHTDYLLKNIYLKIDTQGYEMEVLRGALNSLNSIKAVQAEIALIHTYLDEIDWLEFLFWMRSIKFEVATAICNSSYKAQIREFDFVFINKN